VRPMQSELDQPLRGCRQQLIQLGARERRGLELVGRSGKVHAELLGCGRRLQRLGGLRGHLRQRSLSLVSADQPALRIAFAPGVTVSKWTRRWAERHPELPLEVFPLDGSDPVALLRDGRAALCFVRLPIERDGLSVIRLYGEVAVLVASRDWELADSPALAESDVAELASVAEYSVLRPVKDAVALVAAGVGFLRLPHSLARMNARKDVVAIPISDAVETEIAICWLAENTTESIEEFVGIVRGRTEASSRANPTPPTPRVRAVKAGTKGAKSAGGARRAPKPQPKRPTGKTRKRGSR
jgi:hypothetical protein